MHLYTLVITPGPRRSAVNRAEELLAQAARGHCDYWRTGGWFSDRLGKVARPEIDAWYASEARRRRRFEAEHLTDEPGVDPELAEALRDLDWAESERRHRHELARLERQALVDLARLTSQLPSPLPESMLPVVLVTPDGSWNIRPVRWEQGDSRWSRYVNETIDRYRGKYCIVVADCHC